MKTVLISMSFLFYSLLSWAQASSSDNLTVKSAADRSLVFDVTASGIATPIDWGLDTAWRSRENLLRGLGFIGADQVDLVRFVFNPAAALTDDGDISGSRIDDLNVRFEYLDLTGADTKVTLTASIGSLDPSYRDSNSIFITDKWADLLNAYVKRIQAKGRTVVTVTPFNEPDFDNGNVKGSPQEFADISLKLKTLPEFENIRIGGPNTLNNSEALNWYDAIKSSIQEGNTHQLAGTMDDYTAFYTTVKGDDLHASNDELHNLVEAIAGAEYGLQTGIWWGTPEFAGGQLVKATDGVRLGYAEHRPNWTAAAVYKSPDDKIQAFLGASERQAVETTYRLVSEGRDVFFDGYGPQRDFVITIPGGTGYWQNQPNAERMVNIQWGEDIQPPIAGTYKLVNRASGKVLQTAGGGMSNGTNINIGSDGTTSSQQWVFDRVPVNKGGDFTYYKIGLKGFEYQKVALDASSLNNNANIILFADSNLANRDWYLEYEEDGWFFIGCRQSAKYLGAVALTDNADIRQFDKRTGEDAFLQQWRFIPVDAPVEFNKPSAPSNLTATENSQSVLLEWTASPENDVVGYSIIRADQQEGPYSTIARGITETAFVDNTGVSGINYFYKVKALDYSLNSSPFTSEVRATYTGSSNLVAHLKFEDNILDSSENLNHPAVAGNISFDSGQIDEQALVLNGSDTYLQLPPDVVNFQEITIASWVYWGGGAAWQRIFDFGNNNQQFVYLTPFAASTGALRFGINDGNGQQNLNATSPLPENEWAHVAVTLSPSGGKLFVNGELVDASTSVTKTPRDFKPILNYIGKSQSPDALFNGRIDDFKIFNYTLTEESVKDLYENKSLALDICDDCVAAFSVWPNPVNDILNVDFNSLANGPVTLEIYDLQGKILKTKIIKSSDSGNFSVSDLAVGMYILKVKSENKTSVKKIVIER
ncbi:LamG-like jellyroll fold domain-containing protein [Leeuwenhoekiella sp. NPDC079379]|uniref:LamG-like jellyroll fold domain-containing protein n=1 Tax=Leeuwenhoekiella sp. NPDC079379 TaxID=3364122 RepID=UPI0037C7E901